MLVSPPVNIATGLATPDGLEFGFATLSDVSQPTERYVIRPNHLVLNRSTPDLRVKITLAEAQGDMTVLHQEAKDYALRSVFSGGAGLAVKFGDEVPLRIDRAHLRALPTAS